ncbi:CHAT domain-containing protein [Nodosilinea sp. LEGE 07088]|uniref:CHAT domain-containing protein n=1 Tax=Nodosilinea sp. LEGE 07088 TaxID=2777968 RepID=UPI00187F8C81|nr:CHAT domain-containing protein [Nodosilinea sp. LEGE 07088]MBE9138011.1 CHAT domain-containing protein [Nodosilinea sp. LEGE 07088]
MRYAAKLLGLVVAAIAVVPAIQSPAASGPSATSWATPLPGPNHRQPAWPAPPHLRAETRSMPLVKGHLPPPRVQLKAQRPLPPTAQPKQTDPSTMLQVEGRLEEGDASLGGGSRYDAYTIAGRAGQTITITLESVEFDPFLLFGDGEGNELARHDDIDTEGGNYHSFIALTLPADGTYQIWALGLNTVARGRYRLVVEEVAPGQATPRLSATALAQVEATRLLRQGLRQLDLSQFQAALQSWEQALEMYRELGDRAGESRTLGNMGIAYRSLGQYERAIDFYEQDLAITREIGDRPGEGAALGNLGNAYGDLGQYGRAIDFYEQRRAIAREVGDRAGEGRALGNMGSVYHRLGQYERAIDFYEQGLAIAHEMGDRGSEGVALGNLGAASHSLGQYERAIELYEQNLAIAREIGDRAEAARTLGNMGIAYHGLGQPERAIEFYEQNLAIAREIGDRASEGAALGNLGNAYRSLGQPERAIELYGQDLAIARELGDRVGESRALNNQGATLMRLGQYPQAASALHQSIEIFESLRSALSDSQLIAIADTQRQAYQSLESALIAQNKPAEALVIAERGRARAFVLQLASRLANPDSLTNIVASDQVQAPTIAEIQRIARNTNTTLVTYSQIFDEALHIWVVQPSGTVDFRSVELAGASDRGPALSPIAAIDGPIYRSASTELGELVTDSRASIVVESTGNRPDQLQALHTLLIDPIADLLPADPAANVVFIPQGNLFLVPFAALQDADGTYLIEKHTILTAPSIQVFGLANQAASTTLGANAGAPFSTDHALIVGNPTMPSVWIPTASGDFTQTQLSDLPGAKAEAEVIGRVLNTAPLVGNQATEAAVKQRLASAQLIHLATHGLLDYGDPGAYGRLDVPGAIALTPDNTEDGLLTSAEILDMDLSAELAVLSACDTGRGRITGDGVVGLSRSLITAGVPSVVVSLWAVPDAPTAELMTEFYRQLSQGQTKAQALRQAILTTMEQHPEPRAWAAFTLIGVAD